MSATVKSRLALKSVIASLSAALLVGALGCEGVESTEGQASRKVDAASDTATQALQVGKAEDARKAIGTVDDAAGAAAKARAYALLAEADYSRAQPLLAELDAAQVTAANLSWEIDQLAGRMRAASAMASTLQQRDPQEVRNSIKSTKTAIHGDANKGVWIEDKQGEGDIPTLTAVTQRISTLEGKISDLRGKIAEAAEQRRKISDQAQAMIQKSNSTAGEAGVRMFAEGAKLRQQAGSIGIEIDRLNAQLIPLTGDLARAQAEKAVLEEAIKRLDEQDQHVAEAWKQVGQHIDGQNQLARQILTAVSPASASDDPAQQSRSLQARMQQLKTLLEESDQTREQADAYLADAAKNAAGAAQQAQTLSTALMAEGRTLTQSKPAFDAMTKANDINAYRLQQLHILQSRANNLAHRASMLGMVANAQQRLQEAAQEAKLTPPQGLIDPNIAAGVEEARQQAMELYNEATELATTVSEAGAATPEQRSAARIASVITRYAWANALRDAGQAQEAEIQIGLARSEAAKAVEEKAVFPPMPSELNIPRATVAADTVPAPAPETPATPDGAAPAPEGATPPAGGGFFGGAAAPPPAEAAPADPAPAEGAPGVE